jgi:hypothetical protein
MAILPTGVLFYEPRNTPISTAGLVQPNCQRRFYLTGTTTLATVYQDGILSVPFSQSPNLIAADINGRFAPIYLDPSIVYRSQLLASVALGGATLEDVDPYVPSPFSLEASFKPALLARTTVGATSDPDLQIAIVAPLTQATYIYEAFLEFTQPGASGTTPGLDFEIAFSGSLVAGWALSYAFVGNLNGDVVGAGQVNVPQNTNGLAGANAIQGLFIRGVMTCSTGGVLAVQWGQANSSANAVTMSAGCIFTAQRIA